MAGVEFITYKGKRILYEDYSGCKPAELEKLLEQAKKIISAEPANSILALVNVRGSSFDRNVSNAMKDFVKANTPYIRVSAVYGVEGLMEVIFKSILAFTGRKNLKLFKTIEEAKDYLAGLE